MPSTVSTRFLIISDTHSFEFGDAEKVGGPFKHPTPKCDVLLHCGDLTQIGGLDEYEGCIRMLGQIDAELKLVIAGNHDLTLDGKWWKTSEGKMHGMSTKWANSEDHERAVEMWKGPLAREAGITYLEEGVSSYTLKNGAKFSIYTSPYQPEFCDWAFPYQRFDDRFNPEDKVDKELGFKCIAENPVPDFPNVDIMMTHGPPRDILDWTAHGNVGCHNLIRAVSRERPQLYCFGHIHEAYGAKLVEWKEDKKVIGLAAVESESDVMNAYPQESNLPVKFGKETLMVNAAIMDLKYEPTHAPWVVDLELTKAT
ncbi:Metallophosphoesterase domain-containing protein [Lachnellula suecica]|uniref:Metallophosphoesterase domain-containing protein n=1 Tax=Lachnellula suecica TaxID=602035 RepID=A0A8T9BXZ0_9HELO|nr:Metallophosphoesterase domain-containing protein [Lachnellula suecica]